MKGKKTGGRVAGTPNKVTTDMRQMIYASLDQAGGLDYLVRQSEENPTAYLSLIRSVVPREVLADVNLRMDDERVDEILISAGLK